MQNSFLENTPILQEPLIGISRNLARRFFWKKATGVIKNKVKFN